MEQVVLSREEYDGGQRVVRRLIEHGFDVLAAFWTKQPDDTAWTLHVVSPRVGVVETFTNTRDLSAAIDSLEGEWAHPFERINSLRVRLLSPSKRLAEAVVDVLAKYFDAASVLAPHRHSVAEPVRRRSDLPAAVNADEVT